MKTFGRRAWTKRRGSALVFTSIMMVAITTVVIGTVQVNMVAATKADQRIAQELAEQTFDAQTALVTAISKDQSITLPHSFDCLINGYKMTCTVSDNSASQLRTVKLTAVGTFKGKRFRYTRIIGGRQTTHPFYYALFQKDKLDTPADGSLLTTNNGSVYVEGTANVAATDSVAGDLYVTSTTTGTATVDKNFDQASLVRTASAPNMAALRAEGGWIFDFVGTVNSLGLGVTLSNGHYNLNYYRNANDISGVFSGKGTLVFERNVKVSGNVTYANASARIVFIVNGDLTIDKTVTNMDGFWYVTGKITGGGTTSLLTFGKGSLYIGGTNGIKRPITINWDDAFFLDRVEAQRHCLPGFWPTPATGILR